jgi:hypothetical protein
MTAGAEPFTPSPGDLASFAAFLDTGRLPERLESLIESYIAAKTGKPFDDPTVLERLRRAIVAQKSGYWKSGEKRRVSYRSGYSVLAYLAYQFPVYYFQSCRLLARLAADGRLYPGMRIVDLGTGPGVVPLAAVTLGRYLPEFSAEVLPVEPSEEHGSACRHLVRGFAEPADAVRVRRALAADAVAAGDAEIPDGIGLLVLSNLLNELPGDPAAKAATVMRWAAHLDERGTVLLVEPADLENATGLRAVQRELLTAGLHLRHPCRFLWGSSCGPVPCWSFEQVSPIRPTRLQEALAAGAAEPYRYRNTDIKFAAAVLGREAPARIECRGVDRRRTAPLSQLKRHVNRRIAVLAAVMSNDLGDAKSHVYKVCDGTARQPVFAVLPAYHIAPGNRALLEAPYGSVLYLRDVLVRENPRTRAINLLVGRSSTATPCEG